MIACEIMHDYDMCMIYRFRDNHNRFCLYSYTTVKNEMETSFGMAL